MISSTQTVQRNNFEISKPRLGVSTKYADTQINGFFVQTQFFADIPLNFGAKPTQQPLIGAILPGHSPSLTKLQITLFVLH
jgi:hypothetical protein